MHPTQAPQRPSQPPPARQAPARPGQNLPPDVDVCLETAAARSWRIEHIVETPLHADFVSGHRELADRTGARIYLGRGSGAEFSHVPVQDGDEIRFGQRRLRFLQTPGHTLESICILMNDGGAPEVSEGSKRKLKWFKSPIHQEM